MNQGTILGSQIGRWITFAVLFAVMAVLLTATVVRAQEDGTIEFPENSKDPVAIFSAADPEDDTPITWSIAAGDADPDDDGPLAAADAVDALDFDISATGVLTFDIGGDDAPDTSVAPDFEHSHGGTAATDGTGTNTYSVVVVGTDPEAEGPTNTFHKVVVKVTNVDEDGEVTWTVDPDGGTPHTPIATGPNTLLQFQAGASLMASVMDGDLSGADKAVTNVIWRWYRSPTDSLTGGTLIEGATSNTYQVQDKTGNDDVGMYLRAEASYTDGSGPVVTASRVSDYPVQAFRTNNNAPNFGPDTSTARSVDEGPSGMIVGDPVTATDDNDDILNYTLFDADGIATTGDSTNFKIDQKTGQITTAVALDYDPPEIGGTAPSRSFTVTVRATDSAGLATEPAGDTADPDLPDDMEVTITLMNVNEKPTFGAIDDDVGDDNGADTNVTSQSVPENATGDGANGLEVATYTATDIDANDTVLISLRGDDAAMFQLADDTETADNNASQILSFRASPNYEDPKDKDGNNIYEVIVRASDRGNLYAEKSITVRVTNVDEAPSFMTNTPTSYEFAENGKEAVATFTATDPEGANIRWSVAGTDGEDFDINAATGVLTFDVGGDADTPDVSVSPDFENAGDTGTDNTYNVTVQASDDRGSTVTEATATLAVTVEVTNEDEDGKVTWTVSPRNAENTDNIAVADVNGGEPILQFQDGAILTASATDGDVSGADKTVPSADWQWYKSSSSSSCGTNALSGNGANSNIYTVQAEDRGSYLCAKATYSIGGTEDSGEKVSEYRVGRNLAENNANPTFGVDTSIARSVNEGPSGTEVVGTVTATDADSRSNFGDQLNYILLGTDAAKFKIDQKTGQIMTMVRLNFEAAAAADDNCAEQNSCVVTVRATDSAGAATDATAGGDIPDDMEVTIAIKDVNEKPTFTAPTDANLRTAIDSPEGQTDLTTTTNVAAENVTYEATDEDDGDTGILVLEGLDKDMFELSATGVLSFTSRPDYENPMDEGEDNRYNVIVRATDGTLHADRMIVVNVTDVNEGPDLTRGGLFVSGRSSSEYAENGMDAVGTYTASGSDAASARWSVGGDDASHFRVDPTSGMEVMLMFRSAPDFEAMASMDGDSVYEITVNATDGSYDASRDVTVTVTNEDEEGMVTLSTESPVVGVEVTADLADPDGDISGMTWQWASAGDDGVYSDIAGETSASYTPAAADVGMTLQATATYNDGHGPGKSAMDATDSAVVMLMVSGMANPQYAENGTGSVATYTANAPGATWSLAGDDMDDLSISSSGVLTFNASPDFEMPMDMDMNNMYMVTVMATVGNASDTMDVTVAVTDVVENQAPTFDMTDNMRDVAENSAAGTNVGDPVMATDPDGDTLTYSLDADGDMYFDIGDMGQITVGADTMLDHEAKTYHMVTVTATDPDGETGYINVTINVTNVDEAGSLTLSSMDPMVGTMLTATLTDLDGYMEEDVDWQWSRSMTLDGTFTHISAETMDYTPTAEDIGYYLQVVATYTDGHGPDKMEMITTDSAVPDPLLAKFDTDGSGAFDRDEVIKAINRYLDGEEGITRADVIEVINRFLDS